MYKDFLQTFYPERIAAKHSCSWCGQYAPFLQPMYVVLPDDPHPELGLRYLDRYNSYRMCGTCVAVKHVAVKHDSQGHVVPEFCGICGTHENIVTYQIRPSGAVSYVVYCRTCAAMPPIKEALAVHDGTVYTFPPIPWAIPCKGCEQGRAGNSYKAHIGDGCGRCYSHCTCMTTCGGCGKETDAKHARYWAKCSKCHTVVCSTCLCDECARCPKCEKRCVICQRGHAEGCACDDETWAAANFWKVPVGLDLMSAASRFYLLAYHSIIHPEYDPDFRAYAKELAGIFSRYTDMAIGGEIRYGFTHSQSSSDCYHSGPDCECEACGAGDYDECYYEDDCSHDRNYDEFELGVGRMFRETFPDSKNPERGKMWSFWYVLRDKYGLAALKAARDSFMGDDWDGSIGGHNWGRAADIVLRWHEGDMSDVSFVDTMWGLEHNGGSIFTKIWRHTSRLKKVLDANLNEDYDYLRRCLSGEDRKCIDAIEQAINDQEAGDGGAEQGTLIHWA